MEHPSAAFMTRYASGLCRDGFCPPLATAATQPTTTASAPRPGRVDPRTKGVVTFVDEPGVVERSPRYGGTLAFVMNPSTEREGHIKVGSSVNTLPDRRASADATAVTPTGQSAVVAHRSQRNARPDAMTPRLREPRTLSSRSAAGRIEAICGFPLHANPPVPAAFPLPHARTAHHTGKIIGIRLASIRRVRHVRRLEIGGSYARKCLFRFASYWWCQPRPVAGDDDGIHCGTGVVRRARGARATVKVVTPQGLRLFTTDSDGQFFAPFLIPDSYEVRVELQGFRRSNRRVSKCGSGQRVDSPLTSRSCPHRDRQRHRVGADCRHLFPTAGTVIDSTPCRVFRSASLQRTLYTGPGVSSGGQVGSANPSMAGGRSREPICDRRRQRHQRGYGRWGPYSIVFAHLARRAVRLHPGEQVKTGGFSGGVRSGDRRVRQREHEAARISSAAAFALFPAREVRELVPEVTTVMAP